MQTHVSLFALVARAFDVLSERIVAQTSVKKLWEKAMFSSGCSEVSGLVLVSKSP